MIKKINYLIIKNCSLFSLIFVLKENIDITFNIINVFNIVCNDLAHSKENKMLIILYSIIVECFQKSSLVQSFLIFYQLL